MSAITTVVVSAKTMTAAANVKQSFYNEVNPHGFMKYLTI